MKSIKYYVSEYDVSASRLKLLCQLNRVDGAVKAGKTWLLPDPENMVVKKALKSGPKSRIPMQ